MQSPHRVGKRGGGASAVPPTAGFGRRAKAEATYSGSQGVDAQNAGLGVHGRPGRLLTPRAHGGGLWFTPEPSPPLHSEQMPRFEVLRKMGVFTVICVLLGEQAQRAGHVKLGPRPTCPVMLRKNWTPQLLHITSYPLYDPRAFPSLETPFGSPASQRAMASTTQASDIVHAYWPPDWEAF
jgi:hypothetical protein